MRIVIIEDEPMAADRLENLLLQVYPAICVAGRCDSVQKSVKWFRENDPPDILFLDIQLGDGLSFEIFEQVEISCPVIFTTAYDSYAIDAFRVNSIAYLLKPVKKEELSASLDKYKASPYFEGNRLAQEQRFALDQVQQLLTRQYKKRFLIKSGLHIRTVPAEDILFFYSLEKATYGVVASGKTFLFDHTLDQLEKLLDPALFFRINRRYIVSVAALADIITYSNSRLKLLLRHCADEDILVSRERMQEFKEWLDR
jgi:DNA-binding LytR/AlgR family response regulator